MTRPTLNRETLAAWKWLNGAGEVGNACNRIVRDLWDDRDVTVQRIGERIRAGVEDAFPAISKLGEPDDFRETMRAGLARVDWDEIALLFIEQERWRAKARERKKARAEARRRRK